MRTVSYVDFHTEGEPFRLVTGGFADLGSGSLADRVEEMRSLEPPLWRGVVAEPRGFDATVAGLLIMPEDLPPGTDADFGVIFWDRAGPLGMCGHGLIGFVRALRYLGLSDGGTVRVATPPGIVTARVDDADRVEFRNIPSRRKVANLTVDAGEYGQVTGDVAYGGNWFFITHEAPVELVPENMGELLRFLVAARAGAQAAGYEQVDHAEVAVPIDGGCRKFVLCPSGAYDRSPCGTGTSAHVACLAADGLIAPGDVQVHESVTGGRFTVRVEESPEGWIPVIAGRAWPVAEGRLIFENSDPYRWGLP